MANVVLVPAAGGVSRWGAPSRYFGMPKTLSRLNGETIIQRMVRQFSSCDIYITVREPGSEGWTEDHLDQFKKLGCNLIMSTASPARDRLCEAVRFAIMQIQNDIKPGDSVFLIPGDFVFLDEGLVDKVLSFPVPCVFGFKGLSDRVIAFKGSQMGLLIGLMESYCEFSQFIEQEMSKGLSGWGYYVENAAATRFIEADFLGQLGEARKIIGGNTNSMS